MNRRIAASVSLVGVMVGALALFNLAECSSHNRPPSDRAGRVELRRLRPFTLTAVPHAKRVKTYAEYECLSSESGSEPSVGSIYQVKNDEADLWATLKELFSQRPGWMIEEIPQEGPYLLMKATDPGMRERGSSIVISWAPERHRLQITGVTRHRFC